MPQTLRLQSEAPAFAGAHKGSSGSSIENAGAAISIVAPVSMSAPLRRAEPGANSASAERANTEKAEATESCLDMVVLSCCTAAKYDFDAILQCSIDEPRQKGR